MWAMLESAELEFTRPMYSSISFGWFPADSIRVGPGISVGIFFQPPKLSCRTRLMLASYRANPRDVVPCSTRFPPVKKFAKTGLAVGSGRRYTNIFAKTFMTARDDLDPLAPQREAAFFYGLFLRGHDVETLPAGHRRAQVHGGQMVEST